MIRCLVNHIEVFEVPVLSFSFFAFDTLRYLFHTLYRVVRRVFACNLSKNEADEDWSRKNGKNNPIELGKNASSCRSIHAQKYVTGLMTTQVARSRLTNLYLHMVDAASQAFGMLFFSRNSIFVARSTS